MNTAQLQIKRFLSFNSSVRHDITKLINCQTVESRDCRLITLLAYVKLIDWLSMVLRLRQHTIGYTADGFYRSDDPTNSVKALKEGG